VVLVGGTIEEIKILCSFPLDYKLCGSFLQQHARLGNAVMPKMMFHIAKNIKENILNNKQQPTVISTFAGGGGSSLGYHWAGFKELLAIDFDQNSCDTLKANFDFPVWQKDIKKVIAEEILNFCNIKIGELDVLDGSPPCQGFSTVGKRNLNDSRNDLFLEYIRLIDGLQPKVFVMENVSGMMKGGYKGKFNEILKTLKDTGYNVKCKLMNAMWYEVPQSRERLFFIGVRKDLNIEPCFPEPMKNFISVKNSLNGIVNKNFIEIKPDWYTNTIWDKTLIGKNFASSTGGVSGYSFVKINPDKVCSTIPKSLELGNKRWCAYVHWKEKRSLSIEEIKRLSSFPDDYKLHGTVVQQWARIGNAVMPKMMFHIAKNIKENILDKIIQLVSVFST